LAIKKQIGSLLIVAVVISVGFLIGSMLTTASTGESQGNGFISEESQSILILSDGQIDSFWSSVSIYQETPEFGPEAYVKFANNGTHLFALIVCSHDSEWVSIEFDADSAGCMANQHDGWAFYIDNVAKTVEARDVHFIGTRMPEVDSDNSLIIEPIFSNNLVFIEVVRPYGTQNCDTSGCDIVYENGSVVFLQFASKADHYGAHTIYPLMISDKPIGENGGLPALPTVINYDEIKFNLLGLTLVGTFGFIGMHLIRRVIISPIKHDYRLILKSIPNKTSKVSGEQWRIPSFKDRWNQTFSTKK
jgi:hypothetical protein